MAPGTIKLTTLHTLLDYEACKHYRAEMQLQKSIPEWITEATSLNLKTVLQKYLHFVEEHTKKIEFFFNEEKASSLSFGGGVMHAFIEEANIRMANCTDVQVKDASLLASIQEINHFKISSYGTAAAFANALGLKRTANLFHEAELNEKEIDHRLSELAEGEINIRANVPIALPG
jgi:ferritin-like metal-binding protein YciE